MMKAVFIKKIQVQSVNACETTSGHLLKFWKEMSSDPSQFNWNSKYTALTALKVTSILF